MKKFINLRIKIILFENFFRGLKWCEILNIEDKFRGLKFECYIFIKGLKILIIFFLRYKLYVIIYVIYMLFIFVFFRYFSNVE